MRGASEKSADVSAERETLGENTRVEVTASVKHLLLWGASSDCYRLLQNDKSRGWALVDHVELVGGDEGWNLRGVCGQGPDLQSSELVLQSHVEPAQGCSTIDALTYLSSCCCLVMMITGGVWWGGGCNSNGAEAGCRWQRSL